MRIKIKKNKGLTAVLFLAGLLEACGGGAAPTRDAPPAGVSVSVTPGSVTVDQGATQAFQAAVNGSATLAITWSVAEGVAGGSVTSDGMYTAPNAAGTFHIVATSQADPSKSAQATVTVREVAIGISPASATVDQGASQNFAATVSGTTDTGVTWSVAEGAAGGSVTSSGVYTAPSAAGTFHVVATRQADTGKSAQATVMVPAVTVGVAPGNISLNQGASQAFAATVSGTTDKGVTWSVAEGAAGGSITSNGTYTAPSAAGTFHVVATSLADQSKSAQATVTVAQVQVTVMPDMVSLFSGENQNFMALVSGTVNTAVAWSVQEGLPGGSITAAGVYTAPQSAGTFHVVATSQGDPTRSASATVNVAALNVTVSVFPKTDTLGPGGLRQMWASVTGTSNSAVTWTIDEGSAGGSILSWGLYTAPATPGSFHVTATSGVDPNKSDTATITVVPAGFTVTGGMSYARQKPAAALLQDGSVLVTGGFYEDCGYECFSVYLSSAEKFNPATGTFTDTGSMGVEREGHTATRLTNGKVLVTGGHFFSCASGVCTDVWLSQAELYNPATGTFSPTGNMGAARMHHTATLLADGRVLVAGGEAGLLSGVLASAEVYDPVSGTFSPAGDLATARTLHSATLLNSGKVLIAGGGENGTDSAELFDPASGTFSPTGSMGKARIAHTATLLADGKVLIAGGAAFGSNTAELYDPTSGMFAPTGSMGTTRVAHTATLLLNGLVLVAGGYPGLQYTAELYDPATGSFTATGSMYRPRDRYAAIRLGDGKVLVVGGYDFEGELYH